MVNPLLKAQYNRVRTSGALKTNSLWTDAIGLESEQGTNSAIEAKLQAPGGSHAGREERRVRAQELIQASGYQPKVTSYEGLMSLAKSQGLANNANRGACKICGGLGHLTKQCRNGVSGHAGNMDDLEMAAHKAARNAALIPDDDDLSSLHSSDLSGSTSSSDSDSGEERKRKRSKSKKSKKDKKERSDKDTGKDRKNKKRKKSSKSKSKSKKSKRSKHHSDSD